MKDEEMNPTPLLAALPAIFIWSDVALCCTLIFFAAALLAIFLEISVGLMFGFIGVLLLTSLLVLPGANTTSLNDESLADLARIADREPRLQPAIRAAASDHVVTVAEYRAIRAQWLRIEDKDRREQRQSLIGRLAAGR